MNRQIKFRVWNGHSMEYRVLAGALGHFYVEGMSKKDSACLSDFNTIYNEATPLMQFTGLLDKNGKEIWEGDILYCAGSVIDEEFTGIVKYGEHTVSTDDSFVTGSAFGFFVTREWETGYEWIVKTDSLNGRLTNSENIEVIGNIHENPELLK